MRASRELRNLLLGYIQEASDGDPSYRDVVSLSPEAFAFGSDARELWFGGERIRAIGRAQATALRRFEYSIRDIRAFEEGDVGWAGCVFELTNREDITTLHRCTMVFHREDGGWKAVHFHTSVGVDNLEVMGPDVGAAFDALVELVEQDHPDLTLSAAADGTVTLMFTDIESSTSTNEALGDEVFVPLLRQHNEVVRASVASHGGTVLKSLGDGFMIVFPSALRGVECAVIIQRELAKRFDEVPLRVRMGMHTGEPVRDVRDFFGRDVAYAARIAAAAAGGEILVSGVTKALIDGARAFDFDGPRELELKGFDGPQPIFSLLW